jgi:CRP-like cAMP-binding protein
MWEGWATRITSRMQVAASSNQILSGLGPEDISLLMPLEPIELHQGDDILQSGEEIEQVLFPQSGVISLIAKTGGANAVEIGMIGNEGMLGSCALAGTGSAINDAVVQVSGTAYSLPRTRFEEALGQSRSLRQRAARFDCLLLAQAQQAAACNASHSAQARVCRWLLELRDRCDSDVVPLTQTFLAQMVGVQRTTVTLVASRLQAAGIIRCRRGKVRVLDAAKLEHSACECYSRMKKLRKNLWAIPARGHALSVPPIALRSEHTNGGRPAQVSK